MSYEEYAPWLPKGERAMSDTPYKWERDARANNAEAQVLFERARADAAEAQRDRLAIAIEEGTRALAHIDGTNVVIPFATCAAAEYFLRKFEAARAALADGPGHEGGHSAPAAESTADTDTLPDSTNATIMPGEGESYADSTLSGKPIMPTLTDEEHAAVERTLSRTHEARQARKRAEAQRDRLAAALRTLGSTDSSGRWHLNGCAGIGADPTKGDPWCRSNCINARAALADVPERCDHVERVPGGGDVRCSEPAGHEGEHMGRIADVLAATDDREAMAAIQRGWEERGELGVPVSELRRKDDRTRRRDEAYRAMVGLLPQTRASVHHAGEHTGAIGDCEEGLCPEVRRVLRLAQEAEA